MIRHSMWLVALPRISLALGVVALLAGTAPLHANSVCLGTGQERVAGCNFVSGAGGIEDLDWNFVGSDLQSEESFNPDNSYTSPQGHGKQDSSSNTDSGTGGWGGTGAWSGAGGSGGDAWLGGDDPGSSGGRSGPTIEDPLPGGSGSDGTGWTGSKGALDDPATVPEPAYSSLFALGTGFFVLAYRSRRRSKAQS